MSRKKRPENWISFAQPDEERPAPVFSPLPASPCLRRILDSSHLLVSKLSLDDAAPETLRHDNSTAGRRLLFDRLAALQKGHRKARVVIVYEASCQGFGLYDDARDEGFECFVLAPTKIARSASHRRRKTDEEDAQRLLEILRAHLLAGNDLPKVWIPDPKTREDREIVRSRGDVAEKITCVKAQVQALLKRNSLRRPSGTGKSWTKRFVGWLRGLTAPQSPLAHGARVALATLLRQKAALEEEIARLDQHVEALSQEARYAEPVAALRQIKGVGIFSAMVYLTELGDLSRFDNRKQIGAYLGLAPSSHESGEIADRKGHITRQGPWRVRRVLCQCAWSRVRHDPGEKSAYARIAAKNPKHKKIAAVAVMRRLAILLWHLGRDAQKKSRCFEAEAA